MEKINWKQKLSSRKFWALLAGLVVAIVVMVHAPTDDSLIIGAGFAVADVLAYLFAEGSIDAARAKVDAKGDVFNSTTYITNASEEFEDISSTGE